MHNKRKRKADQRLNDAQLLEIIVKYNQSNAPSMENTVQEYSVNEKTITKNFRHVEEINQ